MLTRRERPDDTAKVLHRGAEALLDTKQVLSFLVSWGGVRPRVLARHRHERKALQAQQRGADGRLAAGGVVRTRERAACGVTVPTVV
ncbi:MAG: hypothetical protein KC492_26005, partial [Myxococcales bacterium]|nr:hypothetical protein [Myxococcales bacterium]